MPTLDRVVVIAVSGRALAQSAARSARQVVTIDAFGDADTRAVGPVFEAGLRRGIGLDGRRLWTALRQATDGHDGLLVTGSGFERHPSWLDRVATFGRLRANPSRIVAGLKDPAVAFEILGALGWTTPVTAASMPSARAGWLQKRIGGAGGIHVRPASGARPAANAYYQREHPGTPMSATFLADGERAHVLGLNTLLTHAIGPAPYCYAGAISGATLPEDVSTALQQRLDRLVRVTALRGLNGIDFLWDEREVVVLEVNPRPTASFELYDADVDGGLVWWHMRSFTERLDGPPPPAAVPMSRGLQVVYADRTVVIPESPEWPDWAHDLPCSRSVVRAGAPALSVSATGPTPAAVRQALDGRAILMRQQLAHWHAQVPATSRGLAR